MRTLLLAFLCCLLPLSATTQPQAQHPVNEHQTPQDRDGQGNLEDRLRQLIKAQRSGDDAIQAKASRDMAELRQTRYPDCYKVYSQCQDNVLKAFLGRELNIPEIRNADVILLAQAPRGEHMQGGVVDHHDLWLRFDQHQVLFADATAKAGHLVDHRFLLARGTNADTWLCDLLRRDIEPHAAAQIWILKRRLLMHENGQTGITLHEYVRLPPTAAATVRNLRK